ncbi:hypothetical protein BV898_04620 [Hypsibius exemplaris]|uniref:Membrane magnesium transporter n=1 Tax=Hypsibius exemplaris TaxID=2072580 RepID=A0A1W0X1W2_HYPEX|nr:hypothetical protein BV898_04620 [Hypsibius exemplaris]
MASTATWMRPSVIKAIFIAGFGVLLHSAISAAQHRSFQRINRQVREAGSVDASVEDLNLPLDIWLETLTSAVLVLWCFVQMTVKLKVIRPEAEYENRTSESLDFRPSFMVFGQKESLYKLRLLDQTAGEAPLPVEGHANASQHPDQDEVTVEDAPQLENDDE